MGELTPQASGWQERARKWAKPDNFYVVVVPSSSVVNELNEEEWHRLQHSLELVKDMARYMAAGMLKGVVKYTTSKEDVPLSTWMDYLLGEGADFVNYIALVLDAYRRAK